LEENQGIIFGSWVNRYYNSEGKLLAPEEIPSHEILASITNAGKVNWKGTLRETLFATLEWGLRFHPKAQITSFLRMPHKLFAKRLPAGAYSIFYIETKKKWWKADIRFPVSPGRITYIGSLQCNLYDTRETQKFRLGRGIKKGDKCQAVITDNLDKDRELFEKTFKIFNSDLDWNTDTRLMEGKVKGVWEKQEQTNLPSIEKPYQAEEAQLKPQTAAASIDVFPSTNT
jgi:hypothetical protein